MATQQELEDRVEKMEKALRMLGIIVNDPQTRESLKIDRLPTPAGADQIWMNTTYCFDIARKLELMFQAVHEIVHPGAFVDEGQIATNAESDSRAPHSYANQDPPDWEQAARTAEGLLLQRFLETRDVYHYFDHLRDAKGGVPPSGAQS